MNSMEMSLNNSISEVLVGCPARANAPVRMYRPRVFGRRLVQVGLIDRAEQAFFVALISGFGLMAVSFAASLFG